MSNLVTYYCALKGIPDDDDDTPKFQDADQDLIRESPLDLPSVPDESPSEILNKSQTDIDNDDSDIITYPEPPGSVYVIPITASQELRYPKPPAEEVYIIPIKNSSETPSDDDEDNNQKQEETEDDDADENTQVDEQQEDDDKIFYPDPPGVYYIIPITNPKQANNQPQKYYIAPSYARPKYAYFNPMYSRAQANSTDPSSRNYKPAYLNTTSTENVMPPHHYGSLPGYVRPTYAPPGTRLPNVPFTNMARHEERNHGRNRKFKAIQRSTKLFEDMFSRADKCKLKTPFI